MLVDGGFERVDVNCDRVLNTDVNPITGLPDPFTCWNMLASTPDLFGFDCTETGLNPDIPTTSNYTDTPQGTWNGVPGFTPL